MPKQPYESGFSEDKRVELRLAKVAQNVLSHDECGDLTDGRVYVLYGEYSLALDVVEGTLTKLEFGTHLASNGEAETLVGSQVRFSDTGNDGSVSKRKRVEVTQYYLDGSSPTRAPYLDPSLVDQIEEHANSGQIIYLTPDSRAGIRMRWDEFNQGVQERYGKVGKTILSVGNDIRRGVPKERQLLNAAKSNLYGRIVLAHAMLRTTELQGRTTQLASHVADLPLMRVFTYRSRRHSDKLGS